MADMEKALALITAVRSALEAGAIHRNAAGEVLSTDREILECLLREGSVSIEERAKR